MNSKIQSLDKCNTFLAPEYDENASNDITANLTTLHFNAGLNPDELLLKTLRKRAHTITVSICMHCTYFICVLNEARHIRGHIQAAIPVPAKQLLLDECTPREALTIGIIGCGRLGAQIARALLTFAEVVPRELLISTRRPQLLGSRRHRDIVWNGVTCSVYLQEQGVKCCYDNGELARRAHVLFLCILPSQLELVCSTISPFLSSNTIIYSLVAGVHQKRLSRLLGGHRQIIRPEYTAVDMVTADPDPMTSDPDEDGVDDSRGYGEIIKTFGSVRKLVRYCPVDNGDSPILHNRSYVEQIIYTLMNSCVNMSLSRNETVGVINAVILGENIKKCLIHKFTANDITSSNPGDEESSLFPLVDLCSVVDDVETPLSESLWTNVHIRQQFVGQFVTIFRQYLDWKKESLRKARQQLLLIYE